MVQVALTRAQEEEEEEEEEVSTPLPAEGQLPPLHMLISALFVINLLCRY